MEGDERLMVRCAEGDMNAFGELVRRHQQDALNIAYRFLGNRDRSEDVAQEAFLKILAGAERYRPTAKFRTYLYNVIWHLCVDSYRRKREQPLGADFAGSDSSPGPSQVVQDREESQVLREAMDELPPRQRMALVLKHFEGLSYEEIAEALECTPAAVDSLLIRAKRTLKEALGGLL